MISAQATPLIYAAQFGNDAMAELLLRWGADLEARKHNGSTALNVAINAAGAFR